MTLASNYRRLIRHVEDVHRVPILYEASYAALHNAHIEDHRQRLTNHETLIPYLASGKRRDRGSYGTHPKARQTGEYHAVDSKHGSGRKNGSRRSQGVTRASGTRSRR